MFLSIFNMFASRAVWYSLKISDIKPKEIWKTALPYRKYLNLWYNAVRKNVLVDNRTNKIKSKLPVFSNKNIYLKSLFTFDNRKISNIISTIIHFINIYWYGKKITYDIEPNMNQTLSKQHL